nr:hypothetical protein [Marinomonas pollencensis]
MGNDEINNQDSFAPRAAVNDVFDALVEPSWFKECLPFGFRL